MLENLDHIFLFLWNLPPALSFIVSFPVSGAYIRWLYRRGSLQQFKQNIKKSKMIFTVSQNQTLCSIQMPKRFLIFNNKNSLLCTTEEGVLIFLVERRDNKMLYFLLKLIYNAAQLPRIGMPATLQRHWAGNSIWILANKRIRKIRTFLPTFYWKIYRWPWKTSSD